MRPRDATASVSPSASPSSSPPPPRPAGTLTSMVVRPSASPVRSLSLSPPRRERERDPTHSPRRRHSPSPSPHFRRRASPPQLRRRATPPGGRGRGRGRGRATEGFERRYSPPAVRRRGSPPGFTARAQRFKEEPGYGFRRTSTSPPRRQRLEDAQYSPGIDRSVGPQLVRGFRGRANSGRFREMSPHHGRGRGGRSFGRGYNAPGRSLSPVEGDVRRYDPNVSPREGDWICRNPSCGNLNFARRTCCSSCNQNRFGPEPSRYSRSPRRGYYNSPPPYESPLPDPPIARGRRNTNGYRSPLRLADDPRDFRSGSPPSRRGNGFPYHIQRERVAYREDEYQERVKLYSPVHEEWDRERDGPVRDGPVRSRQVYERLRSPSPRERWGHDSRERSRSPFNDRPLKGSYMGRGRGGRHFNDSYAGRGRGDDLDAGRGRGFHRGRGFRRGDDGFLGAGRGGGDRTGMSRGRNSDVY